MEQPISYTNVTVDDRRFTIRYGTRRPTLILDVLQLLYVGSTVRWGSNFGFVAEIDEDNWEVRGFKFVPAVTLRVGSDPKELVQTMEDFVVSINDISGVVRADHVFEMTPKTEYYFKRLYAACANKIHNIKACSVKERISNLAIIGEGGLDVNYGSLFDDAKKEISKFLTKRRKTATGKSVTIPRVPFPHFCYMAASSDMKVDMKRSKTSFSMIIKTKGDLKNLFGADWWTNTQGCGVMEGIFPVTVSYILKESSMRVSFKDLVFKTLDDSVVWDTRKRKRGMEVEDECLHREINPIFLS